MAIDLKTRVREVPDWPEPGVGFKDVSPLLRDPEALAQAVSALADWTRERRPDVVLGAEARGFILGAAIAKEVPCGPFCHDRLYASLELLAFLGA